MATIIYLFLCGLSTFICASAGVRIEDWKYWAILWCVIGAFICGKYSKGEKE